MRKRFIASALVLTGVLTACQDQPTSPGLTPSGPSLSVTYTPSTPFACPATPGQSCIGFVGKGDVQYSLGGLSNAQIQSIADIVKFRDVSEVITETSWECTNIENDHVPLQVRSRTTTTSFQALVTSVARVKSQVTGFNLLGYSGTPVTSSTTDGPPVNSCPASPSGFVLTSPAGDPVVVSSTGGLQVSGDNGANYVALLTAP